MAKKKILVVDDEEDILELVRYNLSREGYRVTGTLTGEDALRKVRSDAFDLIVLDLMLPRLRELGRFIDRETGRARQQRAYVDTGPVLERDLPPKK